MTSPLKRQDQEILANRNLADYGVARFRDQVFDAVLALWRRRKSAGLTQREIAERIGRDPGWVSKTLSAPGNWTLRTAGELIQALQGEAEISVAALEDPIETPSNYDAYEGYLAITGRVGVATNLSTTVINVVGAMAGSLHVNCGNIVQIPVSVP
jgi:hypothetical protein